MEEPVVEEPTSRPAPTEVAQTLKQAVSLATRSRSLPSQQAEPEVPIPSRSPLGAEAALPPYRVAASVRQFLAVPQPVVLSLCQVLRLVARAAALRNLCPETVSAHLLASPATVV